MSSDLVSKGMAQVFTGLGILLGAGRISSATHEEIMALLSADPGSNTGIMTGTNTGSTSIIPTQSKRVDMGEIPAGLPRPGKETPVSIQSHDLLGLGADLSTEAVQPPETFRAQASPSAPSKELKIICPWWLTDGYSCREHDQGKCPFYHDNVAGGVKHPLICHFWADGGRCTKSQKDCRFAHYPAPHRVTAPMPSKKKSKKLRSSVADDASHPDLGKARRHDPRDDEQNDEVWRNQGRARPGQEW
ncbi:uncharacterized protein F4807DRAFT_461506 [Annulohypoxylon truncatum]|uniref:uncharacterized protein n=1 Tax=Annulohypoxylon truncatum TaxID=327061 RepID=UPI002008241F|nr:uncharacterized protein F4807DRAFT_461506 [Annulohypoxylon truncatum]KAI1208570.1 hypothetical protein F4807DRAFT_461506 [Annulohypoxylon truncatum]